jgi:hypothetical protein
MIVIKLKTMLIFVYITIASPLPKKHTHMTKKYHGLVISTFKSICCVYSIFFIKKWPIGDTFISLWKLVHVILWKFGKCKNTTIAYAFWLVFGMHFLHEHLKCTILVNCQKNLKHLNVMHLLPQTQMKTCHANFLL